jgi:hypothetical protein
LLSFRNSISVLTALVLVALWTAPGGAQNRKPDYDPEVEAVARTIFLELMSPY